MTCDFKADADNLADLVAQISDRLDADLYLYGGDITTGGYRMVCNLLEQTHNETGRRNAALFLNTYGGDAHAAYRMARAFGHHYGKLTLFVFGYCKSAGTLLALGFNHIVIDDSGELGPMDVQMASRDEMFEYNSGLDMIQAMDFLQRHARMTFHEFLHDIRFKTRLGTKPAGEIARQITERVFSGIYSQLDPVRLGYVQRTMSITRAYGDRLAERSKALRSREALDALVYNYPSHDFVIDRAEARDRIFMDKVVRAPEKDEQFLGRVLYNLYPAEQKDVEFIFLTKALRLEPDALEPPAPPTADDDAAPAAALAPAAVQQ